MVVVTALLVVFSLAGGVGIIFNSTGAIVVGGVGFAVIVLGAYWTVRARPQGCARSRSTERS